MIIILKKGAVLIPVMILTCIFIKARYAWEIGTMGLNGFVEISLNIVPLYIFYILDVYRRKQKSWIQMIIQASFYIYIFAVLNLTIYFILFRRMAGSEWLHNLLLRLHNGINLIPFTIFNKYSIVDRQIIGNLIMLAPLGIYLPILYSKVSDYSKVILIGILTSLSIEIIQLLTSFRSADIDDIILNSIGIVIGFSLYKIIWGHIRKDAI